MENNCTCKTCGKKFYHQNNSCGCISYRWAWDYCSDECYTSSEEYRVAREKAQFIINDDTPDEVVKALRFFWEDENDAEDILWDLVGDQYRWRFMEDKEGIK